MMKVLIPTLALLILNLADGAPTKISYGALASFSWTEEGCDGWSGPNETVDTTSFMHLFAASKLEPTSKKPSISVQYQRWTCTEDSATRIYVDTGYDIESSTSIAICTELESGAVSSTFRVPIFTEKSRFKCEGGDPVVYKSSFKNAKLTLQATLVGDGSVYDGSRGTSRDATVSAIALTANNGTPMPVPSGTLVSPALMYYNDN